MCRCQRVDASVLRPACRGRRLFRSPVNKRRVCRDRWCSVRAERAVCPVLCGCLLFQWSMQKRVLADAAVAWRSGAPVPCVALRCGSCSKCHNCELEAVHPQRLHWHATKKTPTGSYPDRGTIFHRATVMILLGGGDSRERTDRKVQGTETGLTRGRKRPY